MRIFLSAGEPSGDVHAANLIRALRQQHPGLEFVGFGGEQMEAAGCRLLYPLCQLAVMWFLRVLANAHRFLGLISLADRYFHHHQPDAVILIDFPGFNWWVARRAHAHGIPVFYFVPPQLWAWAGWRVRKMQRWVDHVLCSLPFEPAWYQKRGVPAHYVGHPFFDELPRQTLDPDFLAGQRARGGTLIGLLPGSRGQEVERNLETLLGTAALVQARRPDTRFLVACYKAAHQNCVAQRLKNVRLPIELHVGRTPEIIQLSHACVAVSGSVSLELLYRLKPTVVVYRAGSFMLRMARRLMTSPYITLVNLLAGKELYPEFLTANCPSREVAEHLLEWLDHPESYERLQNDLAALRGQAARPGACAQAARYILNALKTVDGGTLTVDGEEWGAAG